MYWRIYDGVRRGNVGLQIVRWSAPALVGRGRSGLRCAAFVLRGDARSCAVRGCAGGWSEFGFWMWVRDAGLRRATTDGDEMKCDQMRWEERK